ncbi:MAG: FAD-binding protein, partial [Bacteroidales bacterium]|nr:FAD-binding protein [Bacteroidales bacterium]
MKSNPVNNHIVEDLKILSTEFSGDINIDFSTRVLYATDASVYRQIPVAVARPKDSTDNIHLVLFAKKHNTSLIPRAAGTSLAGQVVGGGIVVDI